jgi:hypothetical protein
MFNRRQALAALAAGPLGVAAACAQSPQAFGSLTAPEIPRWEKVVRSAGIKVD